MSGYASSSKPPLYPHLEPSAPPSEFEPPPPYSEYPSTSADSQQSRANPPTYDANGATVMAGIVYLNQVLDIVHSAKPIKKTAIGVATQAGSAAAGAAAGGLLVGPLGGLIGGIAGAIIGYQYVDDYDGIVTAIRGMDDHEKRQMEKKIKVMVGAASIAEFIRWFEVESNRQALLNFFRSALENKPGTSQ